MFKLCFTLFLLIIITYFVLKYILVKYHKLYLSNEIVKYPLRGKDLEYLKTYSYESSELVQYDVFYTTTEWSTKRNNYLSFKDDYYIIEPGYYYYYIPGVDLFLETSLFLLKKNKIIK